jgi:hypothetical protein
MMYSRFAAKSDYRNLVYAIARTPNAKRQLHPELELEFPPYLSYNPFSQR